MRTLGAESVSQRRRSWEGMHVWILFQHRPTERVNGGTGLPQTASKPQSNLGNARLNCVSSVAEGRSATDVPGSGHQALQDISHGEPADAKVVVREHTCLFHARYTCS